MTPVYSPDDTLPDGALRASIEKDSGLFLAGTSTRTTIPCPAPAILCDECLGVLDETCSCSSK